MKIVSIAMVLSVASAFADPLSFVVDTNHTNCLYRCGEEAVFTVAVAENNRKAGSGTVDVVLDNFGNRKFVTRKIDLAKENPFVIKGSMDIPGFLRLTLTSSQGVVTPQGQAKGKFVWGVGYEPEKLVTGTRCPDDFDQFWADAVRKLDETVPIDARMEKFPLMCDGKRDVYYVSFATFGGRRVWGMLSEPKDLSKGPFPVRISVPGAGPSEGFVSGDDKCICLTMNVHFYPTIPGCGRRGVGNDPVHALHDAQDREWRQRFGTKGYSTSGIGKSREDYFYYSSLLGINRAVNWLAARPECDLRNFTYNGTSQGGGFGFYLTGLNRHITRAAIFVPAITDLCGFRQDNRQSGWPQLIESQPEESKAIAEKWAPYFDAAHFASRIVVPVRVVVGFADVTCSPSAVYSGYNAIPSKDKKILHGLGMGHGVFRHLYKSVGDWQTGE